MMRHDLESAKGPKQPESITSNNHNLPSSTWHLPLYRPSSFVERASLQIQLADKLKPSWTKNTEEAGLVACCGLGGTGKTSLARDYIHRPYGNPTYTLRAWFSAEYLENDYVEFAVFLGLIARDEKIDRAMVIQQVKEWLETNPGWLLVYDNAHFDYLESFLPTKGGNILITSRSPKWPSIIEVNSMLPKEAEAMVYQLSGHKDADTPLLVKELGYLPLAIAQASAYMKQKGKTSGQYLALYQTEQKALLADGTSPPGQQHQHWPVAITWKVNVQSVAALSPEAKTALEFISYVHAEGIPTAWLQRIVFGEISSKTELELDNALTILKSYSLIQHQPEPQTVSVHRLVQAITRQELPSKQHVESLIKVIKALAKHYDSDNIKITENRALIPHLLAALKHVEVLSPSPLELIPVNADLLDTLAEAHSDLGDYLQAKTFYERALPIKEKHYGPDHPSTGITLRNFGNAWHYLGDYKKAKDLYVRALEITEKHYGPDHPETGITLDNLGNAYGSLGNYSKKKELLLRALAIKEKHYGKDHPQTGITLDNLGAAYGALGDYSKQKDLLLHALEIHEKHYGPDHPSTGITLDNLGNAYGDLGDYEKKKELLLRALTIKEKHYGPDHPETGITLDNLGNAYGALGDYEKKKELLLRALTINETHYGKEHPSTGATLTNLGNAYGQLGDYEKAKDLLLRALPIFEKHYGPDHPETGITLTNLGISYGFLGDYSKKKELLLRALEIKEKHYGPNHPSTGIILGSLGDAYGSLGDHEKEKELLLRALEIKEKHYGPDHPETGKTLDNLGNAYGSLGDYSKKKELLLRALDINEKHYGPEHPFTGITLTNLGDAYGALGDHEKEKELLLRALTINEKHYGKNHPSTGITLSYLGAAYNNLNDPQSAYTYQKRAYDILFKFYGADNQYTKYSSSQLQKLKAPQPPLVFSNPAKPSNNNNEPKSSPTSSASEQKPKPKKSECTIA